MPKSQLKHTHYKLAGESPSQRNEEILSQELDAIERSHPAYHAIVAGLIDQAFRDNDRPRQYVKQDKVRDWLSSLLD